MRGSDVGDKGFCSELSLQELALGAQENPRFPSLQGLAFGWPGKQHACLGQVVRDITYNPGPIVCGCFRKQAGFLEEVEPEVGWEGGREGGMVGGQAHSGWCPGLTQGTVNWE